MHLLLDLSAMYRAGETGDHRPKRTLGDMVHCSGGSREGTGARARRAVIRAARFPRKVEEMAASSLLLSSVFGPSMFWRGCSGRFSRGLANRVEFRF